MNMELINNTIYANPLAQASDIAGWRMEGEGKVTFPHGRMRMEGTRAPGPEGDEQQNQLANLVFWCPVEFPDDILVTWDFWPIEEPGLCILFFAARGRRGEDLFDPALAPRTGPYGQYHHGDIDALHVSYFRRRYASERSFCTSNLRKSYGFHLVAQGADPIPCVRDARGPYRMELLKAGPRVRFRINDLLVFDWTDDGATYGSVLRGGKTGFRQMTPMVGEYANLEIRACRGMQTGNPPECEGAGRGAVPEGDPAQRP